MRMKTNLIAGLLVVGCLSGWLASGRLSAHAQDPKPADSHGWIGTETVKTRFGNFEFKNGYPTPAAADALLDQLKFNRAIEVYPHADASRLASSQSIAASRISEPSVPTRSSSGSR